MKMSNDTFLSLLLILVLIAFIAFDVRSQLRDAQRRIAVLEQRCQ